MNETLINSTKVIFDMSISDYSKNLLNISIMEIIICYFTIFLLIRIIEKIFEIEIKDENTLFKINSKIIWCLCFLFLIGIINYFVEKIFQSDNYFEMVLKTGLITIIIILFLKWIFDSINYLIIKIIYSKELTKSINRTPKKRFVIIEPVLSKVKLSKKDKEKIYIENKSIFNHRLKNILIFSIPISIIYFNFNKINILYFSLIFFISVSIKFKKTQLLNDIKTHTSNAHIKALKVNIVKRKEKLQLIEKEKNKIIVKMKNSRRSPALKPSEK